MEKDRVGDENVASSGSRSSAPFWPKFRVFLGRLFAALLTAGLLVTLAVLVDSTFWSAVCAGGAILILAGIGLWTTNAHADILRKAGPLPGQSPADFRRTAR